MTEPPRPSPKETARERREKRLAEALRANLRRRKAADRPPDPPSPARDAEEPASGSP